MAEKDEKKATPALPLWRPRPSPKKTMTSSISFDSKTPLQTYKPRMPKKPIERRPQQRLEIEVKSDVRTTKNMESFAAVPAFKPELLGEKDSLASEVSVAVQLPLAQKQKLPTPAEILTPEPGDKLMLVQLPSSLPIVYPNDSRQMDYNPLFMAADGRIGEINVYRSGKVTAKIGNVEFDVQTGIPASCLQMAMVKGDSGLEYIEIPPNKLKFTVDVAKMQEDMARDTSK